MKFADYVSKEQKKQLDKISPKKETLSTQDIKELMGMNRPTYKRTKGALRQK
jgi:hypothetical protein